MSETALSRNARSAIEDIGVPTERVQSGTARGGRTRLAKKGTPDIVTPYGWLEAKLPGEEPSAVQLKWHALWRAHGARIETFTTVKEAVSIVLAWRHESEKQRRSA